MPTGCGVLCLLPAKNGDQIGAAPPTVRGVSPLRPELPHVGLSQVPCQCPLLALSGLFERASRTSAFGANADTARNG
jgi:hypothetical protein